MKSAANGGPAYGQEVRVTVCKLLPDGSWKDCHSNLDDGVRLYNW